MTVRDVIVDELAERVRVAKNRLDAAARELRRFSGRTTTGGYLRDGINKAEYERDLLIFQTDHSVARRAFNLAMIEHGARVRSNMNGDSLKTAEQRAAIAHQAPSIEQPPAEPIVEKPKPTARQRLERKLDRERRP